MKIKEFLGGISKDLTDMIKYKGDCLTTLKENRCRNGRGQKVGKLLSVRFSTFHYRTSKLNVE